MSLLGGAAGAYFTYKFLRLLTQKWEDTDAFKAGVVDAEGKLLVKRVDMTQEQKDTYGVFDRLAFNLKRLLNKVPGGKSKIASYAAALYLIKEHTGMTEEELESVMDQLDLPPEALLPELKESFILNENNLISPGNYTLVNEMASLKTGDVIGKKGHTVIIEDQSAPIDIVMGIPIYEAKHKISGQKVFVTIEDIRR